MNVLLLFFRLFLKMIPANLLVVAASYGYAFLAATDDNEDDNDDDTDGSQPAWLRFVYKSLDFGTGRERGARK